MKRFFLFLLALAGLPALWALGRTFLIGLSAGTADGAVFTPARLAFLGGCVLLIGYYLWKGRAWSVLYVFAHEMTHALAGVLCFARIHRINIRETGGFVELSKSNVIITLAPYCVPFYLLIALICCALTNAFLPGTVPVELWSGIFGFFACYHLLYTVDSILSVDQPDILEYGRLFSCWFILSVNLCFAVLALSLTGIVSLPTQRVTFVREMTRSYGGVFSVGRTLAVGVRDALPLRDSQPREASHESDR